MEIHVPVPSLVVLIGAAGSGKSSFAARWFSATEILSSDCCRALVADDENDQSATADAFEILHRIAAKRLQRRLLTVVDATNVEPLARAPLLELAWNQQITPLAVVLDLAQSICVERNRGRAERNVGYEIVGRQIRNLRDSLPGLAVEGFEQVVVLETPEAVAGAEIRRMPAAMGAMDGSV